MQRRRLTPSRHQLARPPLPSGVRRLLPLAAIAGALLLPHPAAAGGPTMALGAAEDAVRADDLVTAKARMTLLSLAGMRAVRVTSQWQPGQTGPGPGELTILRNVAGAAQLTGVRIFVSVYASGSKTTPLTPLAQDQLAAYSAALVRALPGVKDVIVGNEPNLNRFWLPQFNEDGSDAAAPAYLSLLAKAYDAVKAADPTVRVWGGALAPRGIDRPGTGRDTHSPTAFITDLGAAYRASGRALPVMDGLAFHPYPDNSSQPPSTPHPLTTTIGLADYGKLVTLLGQAFDGTAQAGTTLPILYDEFGIESQIPEGKRTLYTGTEPTTTKPVDETQQAAAYALGLQIAFCQPTVVGVLLFHSQDEKELASWQSGVYYADGTPKASLYAVRDALLRTRGGSIAKCDGLALQVKTTTLRFPTASEMRKGKRLVRFRCDLDCAWQLRAIRASGAVAGSARGYSKALTPVIASLVGKRLGTAPVQLELTLTHPVNPGEPTTRTSLPLPLR